MPNLKLWNSFNQPPPGALRTIEAGRLKGKTDINPQWRYRALTEAFGPCGVGWYYEVEKLWTEPGNDSQVFAFATVKLFFKCGNGWSEAIPGTGGSMLVVQERGGPHANDEAYKMAVTDALSVCCKMLGVAADIYENRWDGSRYRVEPEYIDDAQQKVIKKLLKKAGVSLDKFLEIAPAPALDKVQADQFDYLIKRLEDRIEHDKKARDDGNNK